MATGRGDPRDRICCPAHPDATLVDDSYAGDVICTECGLVVGDRVIDVAAEWRTNVFNDKRGRYVEKSRVGECDPTNLATIVSTELNRKSKGKYDPNHLAFKQKRFWNSHRLHAAYDALDVVASRIQIQESIVIKSKRIMKDVLEKILKKKKGGKGWVVACLYIACRQESCPRSFKEIVAASGCSGYCAARNYHQIMRSLGPKMATGFGCYMSRYCHALHLPMKVQHVAEHVCNKADELGLTTTHHQRTVMAGILYMASQACEIRGNLKEIADFVGLTESTVATMYRELRCRGRVLLPEEFSVKVPNPSPNQQDLSLGQMFLNDSE